MVPAAAERETALAVGQRMLRRESAVVPLFVDQAQRIGFIEWGGAIARRQTGRMTQRRGRNDISLQESDLGRQAECLAKPDARCTDALDPQPALLRALRITFPERRDLPKRTQESSWAFCEGAMRL